MVYSTNVNALDIDNNVFRIYFSLRENKHIHAYDSCVLSSNDITNVTRVNMCKYCCSYFSSELKSTSFLKESEFKIFILLMYSSHARDLFCEVRCMP